jgi:hypothetical protein
LQAQNSKLRHIIIEISQIHTSSEISQLKSLPLLLKAASKSSRAGSRTFGRGHLGATVWARPIGRRAIWARKTFGREPFGREGHLGARLLITKYERNKNFKKYKASKMFIFC